METEIEPGGSTSDAAAIDLGGDATDAATPAPVVEADGRVADDEPVTMDAVVEDDLSPDAGHDGGGDVVPDAGAACGEPACHCPHEEPAPEPCPSEPCELAACVPDDTCRFESSEVGRYYVCDDARDWETAKANCESRDGMQLVAIESPEEDAFLFSLVDDKTWVGGTDGIDEGTWQWPDGTAFYQAGGGGSSGPIDDAYENWDGSEPNNVGLGGGTVDCMILWYQNLNWADASCGDTHGYICEVIAAP